jgi:hypothetical protein
MKKEIEIIVQSLRETLYGEPWFGKSFFEIVKQIAPSAAFVKPNDQHSLAELLYHMITWSEFAENIFKENKRSVKIFDQLDWRAIDPQKDTWENGLEIFKTVNENIIALLMTKEDSFLDEAVAERKYNVHYLLNGLIQHHIYHLGQIAYINKMLG